jgi:hypothetical protein
VIKVVVVSRAGTTVSVDGEANDVWIEKYSTYIYISWYKANIHVHTSITSSTTTISWLVSLFTLVSLTVSAATATVVVDLTVSLPVDGWNDEGVYERKYYIRSDLKTDFDTLTTSFVWNTEYDSTCVFEMENVKFNVESLITRGLQTFTLSILPPDWTRCSLVSFTIVKLNTGSFDICQILWLLKYVCLC